MRRRIGAVGDVGGAGVVIGIGVNGGPDTGQPGCDGGCPLGVGKAGGERVDRGASHAFEVGQLGGVAEHGGGGLVVIGFSCAIGGHAVVGAT
jgi:hypothetical protein